MRVIQKIFSVVRKALKKSRPNIRPGETALSAFISSVMTREFQWARDIAVRTLDSSASLSVWAFEYTPASSEPVVEDYLRKVREADFVVWLVGETTTTPVQNEIREAIVAHRKLLVFKLPVPGTRSSETEALLKEISPYTKWNDVPTQDRLSECIDLAVRDEFARAIRKEPGLGRIAILEGLSRASRARCIARWQSAGLSHLQASSLADDSSIGDPISALGEPIKTPICVLLGEFGSGKSLVADRLFQKALVAARDKADAPVPIFLKAGEALGRLREAVESSSGGLGNPTVQGACVVVDGADEVGIDAALKLLNEARLLANTWHAVTITITSRPILSWANQDEIIRIKPLHDKESDVIISRLAKHQITSGAKSAWPESVQEAVRRPLFAVLLGIYLSQSDWASPRSVGELLSWLVARALGPEGHLSDEVKQALQKLAVISIDRAGSAVSTSELARPDALRKLLDSRLIVEEDGLLSFPVPVIAQWFSADALLTGSIGVSDLIVDERRMERWFYPFVIAVGTGGHERVAQLMTPIVAAHPAFGAMICKEALAGWRLANVVKPPPVQDCGSRIRMAMEAWVQGIGPLAGLIAPVLPDGRLKPLGVAVQDDWLTASWYEGPGSPPEMTNLASIKGTPGWASFISARPGRQESWAWRWTLEELRTKLTKLVKARSLPVKSGPIWREEMWRAALALTGKGSLHHQPIEITDIEIKLSGLPPGHVRIRRNGRDVDPSKIQSFLNDLKGQGLSKLEPPWPGPDKVSRGRWIWSGYSEKQMIARAQVVFEGVMEGYSQLASDWFQALAPRMEFAAVLPAKLVLYMWLEHGEPRDAWYLDPLPIGSKNRVEIVWAPHDPRVLFHEGWPEAEKRVRILRPMITDWYSHSYHFGGLDIFHSDSITSMVHKWLESDLRRIGWYQ